VAVCAAEVDLGGPSRSQPWPIWGGSPRSS